MITFDTAVDRSNVTYSHFAHHLPHLFLRPPQGRQPPRRCAPPHASSHLPHLRRDANLLDDASSVEAVDRLQAILDSGAATAAAGSNSGAARRSKRVSVSDIDWRGSAGGKDCG